MIFLLVIDIPNDLNKIRNELTNVIIKKRHILPYLKISDLIICPAKNEGFGRVLIEAMIGDIGLASNSGGHKEIINDGENGFLLIDSLEDFLIQFKILKLDKDYIKKILKALFDASNNYSSENTQKFIEIYK